MNPQLDLLLSRPATAAKPCRVTTIIENLEEPYKTAAWQLVEKTFREGGIADIPLAREFQQAGLQISSTMINRHRNGWCKCQPRKEKAD